MDGLINPQTSGASDLGFADSSRMAGHLASLAGLIEGEVIPRLMLVHAVGTPALPTAVDSVWPLDASDVEQFTTRLLRDGDARSLDYVESLRERGVPVAEIFLNLFAPAARRLGDLWNEDRCSFTEVTLGLISLQHLLRRFAPQFNARSLDFDGRRRIMLAALPGEQHTFGVFMLAEFFRRAGWCVDEDPLRSIEGLIASARDNWFAVAGLSLSQEGRVSELADLISRLREHSLNPHLHVMVGGSLFSEQPDLVEFVGADAGGHDASDAVAQAEALFGGIGQVQP